MKARILVATAMLALVASGAAAQKPATFGIGVAVGPGNLPISSEDSPPATELLFPMNFGAFRFEPIFGLARARYETTDPFAGSFEESVSFLTLGVGAYFTSQPGNGFVLYGGPRLGLLRTSSHEEGGAEEFSVTSTDIFFGAAIGGEHLFSSRFSLGAEARLTHFIAGEPNFDPDIGGEDDFSASATMTSGVLIARFYF